MSLSPAETLAHMTPARRDKWVREHGEEAIEQLRRQWRFWRRPEQADPQELYELYGDVLRWWLIKTGRGWGKNRTGAEFVLDRAEQFAAINHPHLIGLLGRTFDHVRATMIGGESGLAECAARRGYHVDHAATSIIAKLHIGDHVSEIELHTAVEPDRVRGRNFHTGWLDELAAWRQVVDAEGGTTFSNFDLALRADAPDIGPRAVITTTPKPLMLLRELIAGEYGPTHVTHGSLFDNFHNLHPSFIEAVIKRYAGTRLGLQEIEGLLLEDVEGALWTAALIHTHRATFMEPHGRRVVGVDPAGSIHTETGIIVVGRHAAPTPTTIEHTRVDDEGNEQTVSVTLPLAHVDVLDDTSIAGSPEEWGAQAVATYHRWGCAAVIAERNYGGDMVRATVHAVDPTVNVELVTATRGKAVRAEPISTYYTHGRAHHVGTFGDLEGELTTWVPDSGMPSPNRLDALVWAITDLLPPDAVAPARSGSPTSRGGARVAGNYMPRSR